MNPERRQFLLGALAATASLAAPWAAVARKPLSIKVASNQGGENAPLQQLMRDRGFAKALSLDIEIVESKSVSGPMEALLSGDADICMISGYVGILPAIAQGKPLRLVGAAMLLPALAVYSTNDQIRRVEDLRGHTFGVGPVNGLLHTLMLALLRKKGIDPAQVRFVNAGSNAQVLEAVIAGKVDAGLSGVAGMSGSSRAKVVEDGRLWLELPEYTYQPSYASVRALKDKPEALARCVAAYTSLFRYLSGLQSKAAYLDARRQVTGESSSAEGEAVWNFIQRYQPYGAEPGLTPARVSYLQELNVALGIQSRILDFDQVVDLAPARGAKRLLPGIRK